MKDQDKRKSKKPLIILAAILLIIAGIGGYFWMNSMAYATTDDAQINGNIYSVRAGVTAYLDTIRFKDNEEVKKGDTLFVFDTTALKAKVKQAEAALAGARTKLSVSDIQALAGLQNAKASHQSALSGMEAVTAAKARLEKAQKDFERDKQLLKISAVTQAQYDADKSVFAQAQAAYRQARHKQQSAAISFSGLQSQAKAAHSQISAGVALVAQREAELRLAEEQLSHAFVTAPCNGIVTKRSVDEGQYVLSGQSLCAVVDEQDLWITANFKETKINKIKPGQPVTIQVDAYPDLELKGKVASYSGATGAKFSLIPPNNATGNFIKVTQRVPLRINIASYLKNHHKPNSRDNHLLFPGLSVYVKVKTN